MAITGFPTNGHTAGGFAFVQDSARRPLSAEGWIANEPAARDEAAQAAVSKGLSGYHAGHLIPARFGGPGHWRNLVPMPALVNLSYVAAVEGAIGRYLKSGPIYLRVTVEYSGDGPVPSHVRHELFRGDATAGLTRLPGGDVHTNVSHQPVYRMSQARDPYTGRRLRPKDFLDVTNTRGLGPAGPH